MEKDMSLWTSDNFGLTTEISNLGLDFLDMDLNNISRKVEKVKGTEASLGMYKTYTPLDLLPPTQQIYSQIL